MKFIDLFSGLGGFHLALSSLGGECVFASEWDRHAQDVYERNFGMRPQGDITQIAAGDVPDHDVLCGGFPCQSFSVSGKRQGFDDARGTLFFDVARIIREKRPKVVFLENVKHLTTHDNGRTFAVIRNTIEGLDYDFHAAVLNPVDHGVPQVRERVYIVAFRRDLGVRGFSFPKPTSLNHCVADHLLPDDEVRDLVVDRDGLVITDPGPHERSRKPIRVGHVDKGCQGYRVYSPQGSAITLSAHGGGAFAKTGGYLVNGVTRRLHPREAARLLGFPDDYVLHPRRNEAYKQLGNSVAVPVVRLIAERVLSALGSASLREVDGKE